MTIVIIILIIILIREIIVITIKIIKTKITKILIIILLIIFTLSAHDELGTFCGPKPLYPSIAAIPVLGFCMSSGTRSGPDGV